MRKFLVVGAAVLLAFGATARAEEPGEAPKLPDDLIQHQDIEDGALTLDEIRLAGLQVFTSPFNGLDGYGDGPMNLTDFITPGGRPTLQGNGTFLRINGLDAQTCLECHSILSADVVPARLGIGGVGGSNSNAMALTASVEMDNPTLDGAVPFTGRFINPPFLFGSGGVELLANEMTTELQELKAYALANPGTRVDLITKGVHFGSIITNYHGELDTSLVEGVDHDLVIRPFGRKGEFFSVRQFDIEAMSFHFGMQPLEIVGEDVDGDGDGVVNEVTVGELSALSVFLTTMERPLMDPLTPTAQAGGARFVQMGCADCHRPTMVTEGRTLAYRFPEVAEDPTANVFYEVDLTQEPSGFTPSGAGMIVPLFADLKRHDMGPDLAETFHMFDEQQNREFTTARLWGVADTAPYLHDGRAMTLTDAILMHGGEAEGARDAFEALEDDERLQVLAFLRSLRTPEDPAADLLGDDPGDDPDDEGDDEYDDEYDDSPTFPDHHELLGSATSTDQGTVAFGQR